ncbi:MAG: hypothetical protein QM784_35530 [Polyangiaceae bacterium]
MAKSRGLRYERNPMQDHGAPQDDPEYLELRDRFRAMLVVFGAWVVALGITLWSKEQVRPIDSSGATLGSLRGVIGWPQRVDPLATLEGARRFSQGHALRSMTFEGVKSDGTINVTQSTGSAKYVFQGSPSAIRHADRGKPASATSCPKQVVKLRRAGLSADALRADARCEANASPLPTPSCGPKELWARALTQGAPKDGLARIDYQPSADGPSWTFAVPDRHFRMRLSADCKRVLSPKEIKSLHR